MVSTVTPHTDMNPSPRVDVFIDDADLDPTTDEITVLQTSVAGEIEIRNMTRKSSVGGFAATDYEPPLGVPITYLVRQYSSDSLIGIVNLGLTAQVDIPTGYAVLSDPLEPAVAVMVRTERDFAVKLTRKRPTGVYRAGHRVVSMSGLQGLLEEVNLRCWTDTADDRDMFWEVASKSALLVRVMPDYPLPLLMHAVIPDVNQVPFDYHAGGVTDVWDVTGQEVSRPEIDILVSVINYGLFADYMNTQPDNSYGAAATIWATYLDAVRNPPAAV